MITIGECLRIMHSGEHFSCKAVAFDRRRPHKCGAVIEIPEGVLMWNHGEAEEKPLSGERPRTDLERRLTGVRTMDDDRRRPNHGAHYTRNVRLCYAGVATEAVVKVHPALIIEFNGQPTCP